MTYSAKLLGQGEQLEMELRPHMKRLFVPILVFVLTAIAVVVLIVLAGHTHGQTPRYLDIAIAVIGAAVAIRYTFVPYARWLSTRYIITNQRLIMRSGILTTHGKDVPLSRVDDVNYEIDLLDRVFGCGTLLVESGAADGNEVLDDIPNVEQVRLRINELRQAAYGGYQGYPNMPPTPHH